MRRMLKDWGLAVLIAACVFFVVGLFQDRPDLPDEAPTFSVKDPSGREIALSDYDGQTLVLNFWASWCGPCRDENPEFATFHAEHPEVAMLGVAVDQGRGRSAAPRSASVSPTTSRSGPRMVSAYDVSTRPRRFRSGRSCAPRHGRDDGREDLIRATR